MNRIELIMNIIKRAIDDLDIDVGYSKQGELKKVVSHLDLRDLFKIATLVITEHWSGQSPMPDTPDNRPGRWENFRSVVVDLSNGDYPELWEEVMAEYDGDDEDLRKEVKMMQKWIEPYRNMYLPI